MELVVVEVLLGSMAWDASLAGNEGCSMALVVLHLEEASEDNRNTHVCKLEEVESNRSSTDGEASCDEEA